MTPEDDTAALPAPFTAHWLVTAVDGRPLAIVDAEQPSAAARAVRACLGKEAAGPLEATACTWVRRPSSLLYVGFERARRLLSA